jgi:hypothetical protein
MSKWNQLKAIIQEMDDDLGIWGDIIGAISLVLIGIGLFVFVPLIAG